MIRVISDIFQTYFSILMTFPTKMKMYASAQSHTGDWGGCEYRIKCFNLHRVFREIPYQNHAITDRIRKDVPDMALGPPVWRPAIGKNCSY
jgi:hypothetical protein